MEDLHYWQSNFTPCIYSDKLINKIILLNKKTNNKVNINEINKAIYCAKKYHGSQKRDSGEPFYSHPLEVAYMVADYLFETDILIVAILHDTIEDTSLTKHMVEHMFNSNIADQVERLTRIKPSQKISCANVIKLLWLEGNIDLLLIKLFDRIHNLQTIEAKPQKKQRETILESVQDFMVLAISFNNFIIENILLKILTKKLQPKLDLLEFRYCQKTFDYNCQLFSLSTENETD